MVSSPIRFNSGLRRIPANCRLHHRLPALSLWSGTRERLLSPDLDDLAEAALHLEGEDEDEPSAASPRPVL
jgi:hypothetical protein